MVCRTLPTRARDVLRTPVADGRHDQLGAMAAAGFRAVERRVGGRQHPVQAGRAVTLDGNRKNARTIASTCSTTNIVMKSRNILAPSLRRKIPPCLRARHCLMSRGGISIRDVTACKCKTHPFGRRNRLLVRHVRQHRGEFLAAETAMRIGPPKSRIEDAGEDFQYVVSGEVAVTVPFRRRAPRSRHPRSLKARKRYAIGGSPQADCRPSHAWAARQRK
jgi:hypothetical protein